MPFSDFHCRTQMRSIGLLAPGACFLIHCKIQTTDIPLTCSGRFTRNLMKPGTYTVTLYQGEIESGTATVAVSAGGTSSANVNSNLSLPSSIWSIGA